MEKIISSLRPGQATIVLPDGTVITGPTETVVKTYNSITNTIAFVPQQPVLKKEEKVIPIFSDKDRKILSYLYKKDIDNLEKFMTDYSHLQNWAKKELPNSQPYGEHSGNKSQYCYIDQFGNTFASLSAVGRWYQVDNLENFAQKHKDFIRIPEFNSDNDAYIFWHLDFKDHRGHDISIIRMYYSNIFETLKETELADHIELRYSRRIHAFAHWAIATMYARNPGNRRSY